MKLFLATPSQDCSVHAAYAFSLMRTMLESSHDIVVPDAMYDGDIVRVRSRYVADFLESDADSLLFIDADVDWSPETIDGLVAAGRDFVAAPYRRKRPELTGIRAPLRVDGRKASGSIIPVEYPLRLTDIPAAHTREDAIACVHEVAALGLGMALLSREMLTAMVDRYRAELVFDDVPLAGGPKRETVALFQLLLRDRNLLSEDLSFAQRWRDMGGQVWMYLGHGSPVGHHGSHRYAGKSEDFGVPSPLTFISPPENAS